jgi:hypothetical protein
MGKTYTAHYLLRVRRVAFLSFVCLSLFINIICISVILFSSPITFVLVISSLFT